MRQSELAAARLCEVLTYDQDSGIFRWKRLPSRKATRAKVGDVAGWQNPVSKYWFICIDQKFYPAHRLAFMYVVGRWPVGQVDHIDGNRANNCFSNLRDVSAKVNNENLRSGHVDGSGGGLLGVCWREHAKKWCATICVDGKRQHLGYRGTKEEAHRLYVEAKRRLHEGCTI